MWTHTMGGLVLGMNSLDLMYVQATSNDQGEVFRKATTIHFINLSDHHQQTRT